MEIDVTKIKSPADIKGLDLKGLELLSDELRADLIKKLSAHGGHVGPNLGVVEATVALHYVFDAPKDEIVFDVSHQSYVHKMLTGRIEAFTDPSHYDDVTGYTCPRESEYDLFEIGHTSTSVSLAVGLAKARDMKGGKQNVIAFIGDASLGGGMALEALNFAPTLHSNIIIIVNDNQRSIAENHGELFHHLEALRKSNGESDNNIFKALGYEYIYVREGNDLKSLIEAYRSAKDKDHAVVVHVNTMKGLGLPAAEKDEESFHWSMPFNPKTGGLLHVDTDDDYTDVFARNMQRHIDDKEDVVVITAGTPGGIGFTPDRREVAGRHFVDAGICEQDAVTMAAGMAKGGVRPVLGVLATFLQRAYDQLSHDIAINRLPVTVVDFAASVYGINDSTHLGFFDIPMISNIPELLMLAPASVEEYEAMIDYSIGQTERPVVIRTPGGNIVHADYEIDKNFSNYQVLSDGGDVAIIGAGTFLHIALEAAEALRKEGRECTVINPRVVSAVDKKCLDKLRNYKKIVTLEDGIIDGGFGQKIAAYLGSAPVKVVCLGLQKEFLDRYKASEVLKSNGLTAENIVSLLL